MFADAVAQAAEFTRAVLISTRELSGKVETGLGTFILVNADGWILTAAHLFGALVKANSDKADHDAFVAARDALLADKSLSPGKRRKKIRGLKQDPKWLTHVSYFYGNPAITAGATHIDGAADLAAVQLSNLNLPFNQRFPGFGDPKIELPQGRSLCKLGFPFHTFKTEFDEASGFQIKELVSFVRYPLDGIVTRHVNVVNGARTTRFVEMSTPGLRGQSGGPVFDTSATVWGVQSQTHTLQLGFSPEVEKDGRKVTEHQFLNAGMAVYVSEIASFLNSHGISFRQSGSGGVI